MQYLSHLYRALTASKNGPTLYDLCDPLLRGPGGGNAHLRKFYGTAIANPLLRPLLGRAGLPQLRDASVFNALREAIAAARDRESPDWLAIGRPVAALLDRFPQRHPARGPAAPPETVQLAEQTLTRDLAAPVRRAVVDATDGLRRAVASLSRFS